MWWDFQFVCPALLLDQAMASHSDASTSTYLHAINTTLYGPTFQQANESFLGVAHGSETPFVFDTIAAGIAPSTTAQKKLGSAMSASWSAFANSRNVDVGSIALKGWTESFRKNGDAYEVKVLGGPNGGLAEISAAGQAVLGSEELDKRCAFWNSETVLTQMQT